MKALISLFLLSITVSCEQHKPAAATTATPEALENSGSILSEVRKYRNDLVEELYSELTDKPDYRN
jgi:hypothetical protein